MWLRWVVTNLISQLAEDKMRQAVDHAKNAVDPALRGQGRAAEARRGDQQPEPPAPRGAVLFALGLESGGLVDRMSDVTTMRCATFVERTGQLAERRLAVCETGEGRQAAARATQDIIKLHQPEWVVSAGFASALTLALRRGNIVMPNSLVDQQGDVLEVGFQMDSQTVANTPSLHVGRLLTVDKLITHRQEKEKLAADHDAIACDMETMAVAQACRAQQVRFLAVRIISDQLDDKLPKEIESMIGQQSVAGKLGAATGALFQRPQSVKDMWKLRETAVHASDNLAKFLVGVIPQLDS
ncbi:MAG: 5'-methylthioadenosine nucleosidase [Planctomycetota bacterium]